MQAKQPTIIGRNTKVDFLKHAFDVPAKIDTGADTSSVWVSNITVSPTGVLSFTLFGEGSPLYTGEVLRREHYSVAIVRSATGHEQLRYRTDFSLRIHGRRVRATFNLSDRSRNRFPVLIGCRTLRRRFIVDVNRFDFPEPERLTPDSLIEELHDNQYDFYKKYFAKDKDTVKGA